MGNSICSSDRTLDSHFIFIGSSERIRDVKTIANKAGNASNDVYIVFLLDAKETSSQ